MIKKELIVGCNSSVVKGLNLDPHKYTLVSHQDINSFSLNGRYLRAIVFSHSKIVHNNIELLNNLTRYADDIVYISTTSTDYAKAGFDYAYPKTKLEIETYIKTSDLFKSVVILYLGIVIKNFEDWSFAGTYKITEYDQILKIFQNLPTSGEIECFKLARIEPKNKTELLLYKIYSSLYGIHTWRLLRPLDFILKIFGYRWYGYGQSYEK
jgi:hypothetical protein